MTLISSRLKKGKSKKGIRAISPVIATIILIAVALVLALVVGVFAFGLFSSQTKNVSLQSGNFYASNGQLVFTLKNPGTAAVTVSSVQISGAGEGSGPGACSMAATVTVSGGTLTTATCTAPTTTGLSSGNTYDFVISLSNGQSISGSAVSQ